MQLGQIFQPTDAEVDELVCRYPLAQVISCRSGNLSATPIPLLLSRGEDGAIDLLGHLSKANPQVADLAGGASVLIIFQGPDSYISPSWFRDRSRAPTWNYVTAQFLATSEIYPDRENCNHALGALAAAMEKVHPQPWTTAEMAGYEKSLLGIVTIKAKVRELRARFKLGQNDQLWKLEDSIGGLESSGKHEIAMMMRVANCQRVSARD